MSWYDPLRDVQSLGQTLAKATSLGELHAAREANLAQFFTPARIANAMFALIQPAVAAARAQDPERRISLLDNSVGTGRLFQFADPASYSIAGVDVHAPAIEALITAAKAAAFECDLRVGSLDALRATHFDVALINPPFSLQLEAPTLEPLACTHFGRFGPHTSALSHEYALEHALRAAALVVALLPRTFASDVIASTPARLAAFAHLPDDVFVEEGARVSTSILVFDRVERRHAVRALELGHVERDAHALGLSLSSRAGQPKLKLVDSIDDGPAIALPVTGETWVRVVRNGRRLVLKFGCGLMKAKVLNSLYRERVPQPHGDYFRYAPGVRFTGQGCLDLEVLLAQSDPVAALTHYVLNVIARCGGAAAVDPGLVPYLRRRVRRLAIQCVPFRRVAFVDADTTTHGLPTHGSFEAEARELQQLDARDWGSPIIQRGQRIQVDAVDRDGATWYELATAGRTALVAAEELTARFVVHAKATAGGWQVVEPGRFGCFPAIEAAVRRSAQAHGIPRWLNWDYQFEDLIELAIGRGNAVASWEMGLGKSRLGAALCLIGRGKASLYVSEANLVYELANELTKIGLDASLWKLILGPEDLKDLRRINLISTSRLRMPLTPARPKRTYAKALRNRIHTMVVDEAHCAAHSDSLQTQALWAVNARVRYGATGTPIPNYPRDLLPILQLIAGNGSKLQPFASRGPMCRTENIVSMSFCPRGVDAFRDSFVTTEWVTNEFAEDMQQGAKREVPKIKSVPAYRAWVAPMLKRRLRAEPECAKHVPIQTPTRAVHTVPWDRAHLAHYLRTADEFAQWFRAAKADADLRGVQLNLMLLVRRIQEVAFAASYPQQFRDGPSKYYGGLTSKQRFSIEHLEAIARGGERVLCFAHTPALLELLALHLRERGCRVMVLHGEIAPGERMRRLDAEFRGGDADIALLSYGANRTGLNLPQANRVVLYDRDWTPKCEEQAIARTLRPEQQREVHVDYVHLEGSLDEYQAMMVRSKLDAITAGLDWGEQDDAAKFHHLDEIFERFVRELAARWGIEHRQLREELRHVA